MVFQYPNNGPYTVQQAMMACGALTEEKADTLSSELFDDDYNDCRDKTNKDLVDSFKMLHTTPSTQGGVKIPLRTQKHIKAFCQWTKDCLRTGLDPAATPFPIHTTRDLMARAETHHQFMKNYETIASAAKPKDFTKDVKWDDWAPTFYNYLNTMPGRDGVPLSYIVRDNDNPDHTPNINFLDDYVMMAALTGSSYKIDSTKVHAFIQTRIMGNEEAEATIKPHEHAHDGRKDWKALKEHYEGSGIFAKDIIQAENDLASMIYTGEKRPTMYWTLFETRLNRTFHIFAKAENVVFSDAMKLRRLLSNIQCEWLNGAKNTIKGELSKYPMVYTYSQALALIRTEVNERHPAGSRSDNNRRALSEAGRGRGRGGRGRGGGRGRATKQYDSSEYVQKTRDDSTIITLTNGKKIEYHPAFRFDQEIFELFTQDQYDKLRSQRKEYAQRKEYQGNNNDSRGRGISEANSDIRTIAQLVKQELQTQDDDIPENVSTKSGPTALSQVTTSLVGGRNGQANKKQKHY